MSGRSGVLPCLIAFSTTVFNAGAEEAAPAVADLARGEYLVAIMECAGCHTTGALRGQRRQDRHLAGSEVGLGYAGAGGKPGAVFPPNLTSDPATGLGPPILAAAVVSLVPVTLIVLATELPGLQRGLLTTSLSGFQWLASIGLALALPIVVELNKWLQRRHASHAPALDAERALSPARALATHRAEER